MEGTRTGRVERGPRFIAAGLAAVLIVWVAIAFVEGVLVPGARGFVAELTAPVVPSLALRIIVSAVMLSGAVYTQRVIDRHLATVRELDRARYELELIYDNDPDAILVISRDLTVTYANRPAGELAGIPCHQMVGRRCHEVLVGSETVCDGCRVAYVLKTREATTAVKHETLSNGIERWFERLWYPVLGHDDEVEAVVEISRDITDVKRAERAMQEYSERLEREVRERTEALEKTNASLQDEIVERRRAERALRESEERFRTLVEFAPDLILVHIEGVIAFVNPYGARMLGYEDSRELLGMHILEIVDPHSRSQAAQYLRTTIRERKTVHDGEVRLLRKDGEYVDVQMTAVPLMYHGRPAVQAIAHDITERKRAEETIRRMAYYDILTGLPNRALFDDRLAVAISQADREETAFAVMFMDLNDFKVINDTLGHQVGDQLLAEVARRLQGVVRRSDTVARLGGDEFTVLLPRINTRKAAALVARKMVQAMERPLLTEKGAVPIELSIGIAFYPSDGRSFSELMHAADMAMYASKQEGTPFRFADPGLLPGRTLDP